MGQSPLLLSVHLRLKQFSDPILYLQGGCNFILCRPAQRMWNFFVFRSSSNFQLPISITLSLSPSFLSALGSFVFCRTEWRMEMLSEKLLVSPAPRPVALHPARVRFVHQPTAELAKIFGIGC